ncbi:Calcium-dependent protein kinase 1 [Linum perenne]
MGNNCVGPSAAKNGFLQIVFAAMWRSRLSDDDVTAAAAQSNGETTSEMTNKEAPFEVQDKPQEQVTIPKPDKKLEKRDEKNPEQQVD